MTLTRERLLQDLYTAYYGACRHKRKRSYVRRWERNLKANMEQLCDDLYLRRYRAQPSKCFIVNHPKKREVFCAAFRDRIVHHLYFDYTHDVFERTFIADSYSCIKGRGTHYGIRRIAQHIRQESQNYTHRCYALKLDIRGYFMHIDRRRLLDIALQTLRRKGKGLDLDFLQWLTREIVMLNPTDGCIITGKAEDWQGLDPAKSMRNLPDGLGLPIGNLTSQLFSNVYLNTFDQFMKRTLGCRHYGRYVDDAVVVSCDREWLLSLVPRVKDFLQSEIGLQLHDGKQTITDVRQGVEFLGAYIRPWRIYTANATLRRIEKNMRSVDYRRRNSTARTVNSYLGIMQHTASYNQRRRLFMHKELLRIGHFNDDMTKFMASKPRSVKWAKCKPY